jgi:nitrogen fixation NifU-like protein
VSPLPPRLDAHFRQPRHVGDPAGADAAGRAANSACGDALELGLWSSDGRVVRACWRARGCSATLATASLACEQLAGLTLEQAEALDLGRLLSAAGGLPPGKGHARALVERALTEALRALRARYP